MAVKPEHGRQFYWCELIKTWNVLVGGRSEGQIFKFLCFVLDSKGPLYFLYLPSSISNEHATLY